MAIESSIALGILVVALAGLMQIVSTVYATDRMGRVARALARAVALDASAYARRCEVMALELDPRHPDPGAFACEAEWTVDVRDGVGPAALPAALHDPVGLGSGELILVRVAAPQGGLSADSRIAIGIARREPRGTP